MSKEISLSNISVPTHLANRVGTASALAESMTGGISSGVSVPRISIKGSRFRIVDGDTETVLDQSTLDVIIVGANPKLSKTWYAKPWSPDAEPAAPDCFSLNGISPDPASENIQNDLCATCEHNAWGSKIADNGQQLKACSDQKRLAIVGAEDPEGTIFLLQVTPAALKGLNKYQKELSMRGIPPEIVKTKVSFDTDASFPKLMFSFGGFLDEDTQASVDKLFGSKEVKEITGELSAAPVAKLDAPAKPAPAKPAAKQEEEETEQEEEEEETSTVNKSAFGGSGKAKTTKKATTKKAEAPAKVAKAESNGEDASALAAEIAELVGSVDDE